MSSLSDSISTPNLQPNVSAKSGLAAFIYPFLYAVYSPDSLIAYVDVVQNALPSSTTLTASLLRWATRSLGVDAAGFYIALRVLLVTTAVGLLAIAMPILGLPMEWVDPVAGLIGVLFGSIAAGIIGALSRYSALGIVTQAVFGVICSTWLGVYLVVPYWRTAIGTTFFIFTGLGTWLGVVINMKRWYGGELSWLRGFLPFFCLLCVAIQAVFTLTLGIERLLLFLLALLFGLLAFLLALYRVDDWLLRRFLFPRRSIYASLPRMTYVYSVRLSFELENELEQSWQRGLDNCVEVLRYTNQRDAVLNAIRMLLMEKFGAKKEKPKEVVQDVEQIWQKMFRDPAKDRVDPNLQSVPPARRRLPLVNGDLRIFLVPPLRGRFDLFGGRLLWSVYDSFVKRIDKTRKSLNPVQKKEPKSRADKRREFRQQQQRREQDRPPLTEQIEHKTNLAHAVAGLWYFEKVRPKEAAAALEQVKFAPLGFEMLSIANKLEELWNSENLPKSGLLELPKKPGNAGHGNTWNAFANFRNIVRFVWLLRRCASQERFDLVQELLKEEAKKLPDRSGYTDGNSVELAEEHVIRFIAEDWKSELNALPDSPMSGPSLGKLDKVPFVCDSPLTNSSKVLLRGRNPMQGQLSAAWKEGDLQPVLITGQRQSGKSSLIRIAVPSTAMLSLVSMRQLNVQPRSVQILQAICDEIVHQNIFPRPVVKELHTDPERVFSGYIKTVCLSLAPKGLAIALDEFEFVEQRVDPGELSWLMSFLWSLSQSQAKLGVAFLTTSTLAELNAKFDTPFTQYMQPIELTFLSEQDVAQLLRNPTDKFLPYCHDLAVRRIMALTAGQPYLVQVCAAFLFAWYNGQIGAKAKIDPLLTGVDVIQALQRNRAFHLQCERYYYGICAEAEQIDALLALPILHQLAKADSPLYTAQILRQDQVSQPRVNSVLDLLCKHQIIEKEPTRLGTLSPRWQIKVWLFREWLRKHS